MAKKTRLSEDQILAILAEQAAGAAVGAIVKKHGISSASFYNWKATFGGSASKAKRGRPKGSVQHVVHVIKAAPAVAPVVTQHDENQRLKVMLVDLILQNEELKVQLARR